MGQLANLFLLSCLLIKPFYYMMTQLKTNGIITGLFRLASKLWASLAQRGCYRCIVQLLSASKLHGLLTLEVADSLESHKCWQPSDLFKATPRFDEKFGGSFSTWSLIRQCFGALINCRKSICLEINYLVPVSWSTRLLNKTLHSIKSSISNDRTKDWRSICPSNGVVYAEIFLSVVVECYLVCHWVSL